MPQPSGKFQKIAAHQDIMAACAASLRDGTYSVEATRGDERWRDIFPRVMNLLHTLEDTHVKVTTGDYSIVAEQANDQAVAVVYKTGAPVSKSVRRMLRTALGRRRSDNANRSSRTSTPPEPVEPTLPPPIQGPWNR